MRPFVLWGIAFITTFAVAGIGFFALRPFLQRTITPQTITQQGLSETIDLRATWVGNVTFWASTWTDPSVYCIYKGKETLQITAQSETTIAGSVIYNLTGTPHGYIECGPVRDNIGINSTISGTRITNLKAAGYGTFAGSYTTDTITLNQTASNQFRQKGPANLLRQ